MKDFLRLSGGLKKILQATDICNTMLIFGFRKEEKVTTRIGEKAVKCIANKSIGGCRDLKNEEKMLGKTAHKREYCILYGSNCGMCMIGAPYPYCCRSECGNKEYCDGCEYRGENEWEKSNSK